MTAVFNILICNLFTTVAVYIKVISDPRGKKMIKNYFNIAVRNFLKHKFYSLLNIAGLAAGIASTILIILYISDELSYDMYHKNVDNIYRVSVNGLFGGKEFGGTYNPAPLAKTLVADFPEVKSAARFRDYGNYMLKYGEKNFKESRLLYADNEMFEIFTYDFISGDASTALKGPNTLVMTEKTAHKYFGNEDPVGKTVLLDNKWNYKVTGVIKNPPSNTHIKYDIYASLESIEDSRNDMWLSSNYQTYVLLEDKATKEELEAKLSPMLEKYFAPQLIQYIGASIEEFLAQGNRYDMFLEPLADIHLYSQVSGGMGQRGDIKNIYIFASVGLFILLIACINFINLSTARSAGRAREVGVRKVLGSYKKQLIYQFLAESMIVSIISTILALAVVNLVIPSFNDLAAKEFNFSQLLNGPLVIIIIFITIFTGLIAGSYPAFLMSSFKPVAVLRGSKGSGSSNSRLRNVMVVFQFAVSIILIVGTTVIYNQLNYIKNKKLGFEKEQVLIVQDAWLLGDNVQPFCDALKSDPNIVQTSVTGYLPVWSYRSSTAFFNEGEVMNSETSTIQNWRVDCGYIETMGMEIIQGRDFSEEMATDTSKIIINEACARQFNLGDKPVGKRLGRVTGEDGEKYIYYEIIGVVKDFHYSTLHNKIEPLVLYLDKSEGKVAVRFNTADVGRIIGSVENIWKEFAPGQPFEYSFLNDDFNNMYKTELRTGQIFTVFALLAIIIACLGLLGLSAFTAEQKTKEIGIRKTLGASVKSIVILLSKEYGKLIIIAFGIAVPSAYYMMDNWLADFAFRIEIGFTTFLFAGVIAFVIAMIAVGYHSLRAALSNPVDSLKFE